MNHYWLWFLIWIFLSVWLAVTWALFGYGRELWNRTQHLMEHTYYLQQILIMSKQVEKSDILNDDISSQEEGD